MAQVVYKSSLDGRGGTDWIFKPYYYWAENIADECMAVGINSKWFHDWLFETYNVTWSYQFPTVTIHADNEDWIRFVLEWG